MGAHRLVVLHHDILAHGLLEARRLYRNRISTHGDIRQRVISGAIRQALVGDLSRVLKGRHGSIRNTAPEVSITVPTKAVDVATCANAGWANRPATEQKQLR